MQIKMVKVPVVFELKFSPESEDLVPCLVGSLKELGTWNRCNGLVARKIDEDSTKWTVELEIPQMSFFFFNWVMTNNGQFYEEESTGCRKANVGVFGGVFRSEYGEKWTEFSSFCGCQISVSTHYVLNNDDEQIVVMGSGKLLGNWKTWVPSASDDPATYVWTAKFELEHGTTEEFKWVILDRQTREIRRWQEGENRIIKIEAGLKNKIVFSPWGGRFVKEGLIIPAVTVEDWSDYHPKGLSRSFAIDYMIGQDDDEIETNNSNREDPKHTMGLVTKIPSVGDEQYVAPTVMKVINNTGRKPCFNVDLLAGEFGTKVVTQYDLIQMRNLAVLREIPGQVLKGFTKEEQSLPCFPVDLLTGVFSLAVTGPFPEIAIYIEDEMQLGLASLQTASNLLTPSPGESRTSLPAAKFSYNHDRSIVSRFPILDDDTDLLARVIGLGESRVFEDRVASRDGGLDIGDRVIGLGESRVFEDRVASRDGGLDIGDRVVGLGESRVFVDRVASLDGGLDIGDRVVGLDGSLDQSAVELEIYHMDEITYSDAMVTELQNTQVQDLVEANTEQDWSEPRKALYSVFTGLNNFCRRFMF